MDTLEAMAVTTSTRTTQSVLESYLEKFRGLGFLEDEVTGKAQRRDTLNAFVFRMILKVM